MLKFDTMKKYKPISLSKIRTYPLLRRKSKVDLASAAIPHMSGNSFNDFIHGLPDILAARDLTAVIQAVISARKNKRPVILGMGAHPVKVGLSPIIIDLMKKELSLQLQQMGPASFMILNSHSRDRPPKTSQRSCAKAHSEWQRDGRIHQ